MYTKINLPAQIAGLQVGDILKRFPSQGPPENVFDEERPKEIDTYEIQFINLPGEMIGLVMSGNSISLFASPGRIGRLFIKTDMMQEQNLWWI